MWWLWLVTVVVLLSLLWLASGSTTDTTYLPWSQLYGPRVPALLR